MLAAPWKAATWIQPVPRVVAPLHRINPQLLRHASAALTRRRPAVTLAGTSLLHSLLPLTSVLGVSAPRRHPCPLPTPQSRHPPALRHDSHASHATRLPDLPAPCACHATIVSSHGLLVCCPVGATPPPPSLLACAMRCDSAAPLLEPRTCDSATLCLRLRTLLCGRRVMLVEKMHRDNKPRSGNQQARARLLVATTLSGE